jgi:hypothetical protein
MMMRPLWLVQFLPYDAINQPIRCLYRIQIVAPRVHHVLKDQLAAIEVCGGLREREEREDIYRSHRRPDVYVLDLALWVLTPVHELYRCF